MTSPLALDADTSTLARQLGLSRWTISRALNGKPGIAEATRKRIAAAVAEIGFQPNVYARGLRGAGINTVGLVLPTLSDPFWMPITSGLCEGILIRGFRPEFVLVPNYLKNDNQVWGQLSARQVTATLVLGAGSEIGAGGTWRQFARNGLPVIFVEPSWSTVPDGVTCVRYDYREAATLISDHISASNHQGVSLTGFRPQDRVRVDAIVGACNSRGIECMPPDLLDAALVAKQEGPRRPRKATERPGKPTVTVAADDLVALRLMSKLKSLGQEVPVAQSIIGYGNDPAAALFVPPLTTIDPQREQLVARTLELLDELLRDPRGTRGGSIWIPPLLRQRSTVWVLPGSSSKGISNEPNET